jgi:bacterial/archaeal transporter family protein
MQWAVFAFVGTFFWALTNIVDKVLREKYLKDSVLLTAAFGIGPLVSSLILLPIVGFPKLSGGIILFLALAGLANALGCFFYVKALSVEEASRVAPLFSFAPVFILILATIFLGEKLTLARYAAFALILVGGIILSGHRLGKIFHFSHALYLIAVSTFFNAVMNILLKASLSSADSFWSVFLMLQFSVGLSQLLLFFIPRPGGSSINWRPFIALIVCDGLFSTAGRYLSTFATLLGPVSLVSVFGAFQALFVLIFAIIISIKFPSFLKEALDKRTIAVKLAAICVMGFGIYLLY